MKKTKKAILAAMLITASVCQAAMAAEENGDARDVPWNGHVVAIDAGHQAPGYGLDGTEPVGPGSGEMKAKTVTGTSGWTSGYPEYELNLAVSLLLQEELEARGYNVVMTRENNETGASNIDRAQTANNAGADIMVRIHANGLDDTSVDGALCMVPSAANPYVGEMHDSCKQLGECILGSYCEATGLANDGIQDTDNMTGINWSKMPVTILEMGFMTNEGDDLYMANIGNHPVMAAGIADGIDAYFSSLG